MSSYSIPPSSYTHSNSDTIDFELWKPFPRAKTPPKLQGLFTALIQTIAAKNALKNVYDHTVNTFISKYGAIQRGEFIEQWMGHELRTIFNEAMDPSFNTRTENVKRFFSVGLFCPHDDTCLCYLDVGPDAGVPEFPQHLIHMGWKRKENLKRMHHLLVQFLILLASAGRKLLPRDEASVVRKLIAWTDPAEQHFLESSKFEDIEDDRRYRYLEFDAILQRMVWSELPERCMERLCTILGRRILVLAVTHKGFGYLFAKKETFQYWDLQRMVSYLDPNDLVSLDEHSRRYLLSDARAASEQKKFPLRVINTHTLELEIDTSVYRDSYAILSHTWTQNGMEVLYKDVHQLLERARKDVNLEDSDCTHAEKKLLGVIDHCRQLEYHYVWIDNCLINKEDIPELTESLPNMGDWYANAAVCIVYLEDFEDDNITEKVTFERAMKTRWATRGWTLQEIVMSPRAKFFNRYWVEVGDTEDPYLRNKLARISHVPANMLCCGGPPDTAASLILQLSATRKTFKPEDRAYSLLGMLRVRISVDYGEGAGKAMSRVFSAVLETTGDVSIFNWSGKLLQSPGYGRSLYPADYNAFRNFRPTEKPAYANSPIRVDHIGLNARFEICEFEEIAFGPGSNKEILDMVSQMRKVLRDRVRAGPRHTDVGLSIYGMFKDKKSLSLSVICSLEGLEAVLLKKKRWAMARFAGLETAHWWLCEMDSVVGGLEIYARRIATDELEQDQIPKDNELFQQVDMWVK